VGVREERGGGEGRCEERERGQEEGGRGGRQQRRAEGRAEGEEGCGGREV